MFVQCKITFFFFNDTATTEIYTLSLHDALPIWASALIGNFLKIIPILTVENGKTSVLTKVRTKGKAIKTMVDKMLSEDRKSTRLNSSHANISYAVFCLKKKKK